MKKYKTMQWLANRLEWIRQRIGYWGDKLLTLIFYLLVGLFILVWKLTRWGYQRGILLLKYLKGNYHSWRLGRRIKNDFKTHGLRYEMKEKL